MSGRVSAFAARKVTQSSSVDELPRPAANPTSSATEENLENDFDAQKGIKRRRGEQASPGKARLVRLKTCQEEKPPQTRTLSPTLSPVSFRGSESEERRVDEDEEFLSDHSREYNDGQNGSEVASRTVVPPGKLSNFGPRGRSVLHETETEWAIRLSNGDMKGNSDPTCPGQTEPLVENLAILGQYDLWVRKGAISISGAILHASSEIHRVYAPSTHAIPSIRPIRNPYGPEYQPVEVTIRSCSSRIRMLEAISPNFRRIWNATPRLGVASLPSRKSRRSFQNIRSVADDLYQRPLGLLCPHADWDVMLRDLPSMAKDRLGIMVCGPKGSGKSTMCRLLANRILTAPAGQTSKMDPTKSFVAFLDLDPGQPEFSAPGQISLVEMYSCNLGVPYTHPMPICPKGGRVLRAHHIGSSSPRDDPKHYLACVFDLLSSYQKLLTAHPRCPLLINSSGWIQGSGLDILVHLIQHVLVTDVVSIYDDTWNLEGNRDFANATMDACNTSQKRPCRIKSLGWNGGVSRTASQLRMMQTFSYFHLDSSEAGQLRWNASPVTDMVPMFVPFAGPQQAIFASMILGDEQAPELLDCVLNGSVVGLVVIEDESAIPNVGQSLNTSARNSNEHSPCTLDEADAEIYEAGGPSRPSSSADSVKNIASCAQNKNPRKDDAAMPGNSNSPDHLEHPSIHRTSKGIPYLPATTGITLPLNPSHSYCLGQALIQSIDYETMSFHLITPVPSSTLQTLHREQRKILLVRGKLETPTWAYREGLEYEESRQRRREKHFRVDASPPDEVVEAWLARQPWASINRGKRKGSAKARRVRRDIKYKSQGSGDMNE